MNMSDNISNLVRPVPQPVAIFVNILIIIRIFNIEQRKRVIANEHVELVNEKNIPTQQVNFQYNVSHASL